ncbi:hypothetical protein [Clostridium manihotivorum]|uniref:Uncharacterized protein n=1 Tax=Clostridium manihotivorum TaxID=2320868 RepID=A0A410DX34_9CLOT|nr:hypothetical protein [Clostridium manihotivorum]QAA33611.1 hypothetical protein C1I91_19310 [Clostridium manihotivorum]
MADTIYKIIPESHNFFPSDTKAIDGAVNILKTYIKADSISWEGFENTTFIDCGSNFELVKCSHCGANISEELWQEMMSRCYAESRFDNLNIYLQCCKKTSTLNELQYIMDCVFSKFVIEILNPVEPPCNHDVYEASKCFDKLKLKMITARY